jgi:hypothetical protein
VELVFNSAGGYSGGQFVNQTSTAGTMHHLPNQCSAGVKLSLSSLTVVNASLGPGLLELPALLSDNVSQLSLANVDVVANCLDYGRQVAAFAANASGQVRGGFGNHQLHGMP